MASPAADRTERVIAKNRRARFEYEIVETVEAGLVLRGTEVKSLREGRANLVDSYASFEKGEAWLVSCNISEYQPGSWTNHDPTRRRKILMKRRQIEHFAQKVHESGLTLVPLRLYWSGSHVKVELGLARGRKLHDKRQVQRERDLDREARVAMKTARGKE